MIGTERRRRREVPGKIEGYRWFLQDNKLQCMNIWRSMADKSSVLASSSLLFFGSV